MAQHAGVSGIVPGCQQFQATQVLWRQAQFNLLPLIAVELAGKRTIFTCQQLAQQETESTVITPPSEPPPVVDSGADPFSEDMEEAEFYMSQGLEDEAHRIYQSILQRSPKHAGALAAVAEIEGVASVSDFERVGDEMTFTHPNTDGEPVAWRVTFESVQLDPPPEEAVPKRGDVISSWYADGERIEPIGSMARLPEDIWQSGVAQDCYALWIAEERRWDF